jgi:hypothetical protein
VFFFYLFVWFITNLILLNVILAIIVDSFSQLRDRRLAYDEDKYQRCLVCSIAREVFDRAVAKHFKRSKSKRKLANNSFKAHTEEDHNPKNYLFFLIYLQSLHKTGQQRPDRAAAPDHTGAHYRARHIRRHLALQPFISPLEQSILSRLLFSEASTEDEGALDRHRLDEERTARGLSFFPIERALVLQRKLGKASKSDVAKSKMMEEVAAMAIQMRSESRRNERMQRQLDALTRLMEMRLRRDADSASSDSE